MSSPDEHPGDRYRRDPDSAVVWVLAVKARRWVRNAWTGRFARKDDAVFSPDFTVTETDSNAVLRLRVEALEAVMREQARNLRLQTGIQNLEWIANELDKAAGDEQT